MSLRFLAAVLAAVLVTGAARAGDETTTARKAAEVKPATAEAILAAFGRPVVFEGDLTQTALAELVHNLAKRYEINLVIRTDLFKAEGYANPGDLRPDVALSRLDGVTLRQFLDLCLSGVNATYLVRKGVVEIVPVKYAAKETGSELRAGGDGEAVRLAAPLVSAVFKEKPLSEVLANLAEEHDLTVAVAPQANDAKAAFVTARLLNVPADKALELVATQADLRVVRTGAAFLVTTRDHANELFGERLERERQRIELERFRKGVVPPPPPAEKKD